MSIEDLVISLSLRVAYLQQENQELKRLLGQSRPDDISPDPAPPGPAG